MNWIKSRLNFIYEAKANPVYNERVRKAKYYVKKLLPKDKEILSLINGYFFTEEYNNFCKNYLIPIIDNSDLRIGVNLNYDHGKGVEFGASCNLNVTVQTSNEYEYRNSFSGLARLLSDLNNSEYSKEIINDMKKNDKVQVFNYLSINPCFHLGIHVEKHYCRCELFYSFSYGTNILPNEFKYKNVNLEAVKDIGRDINKPKDITKEDIINIIRECLTEGYIKLNNEIRHFDTVNKLLKTSLINRLKKEIEDSNYDFKLVGILKHYPNIINDLNLDMDRINTASELGEIGF